MKFPDPIQLVARPSREKIVFAGSQLSGNQSSQDDYFINFNDECFVISDGVAMLPHGDVAAKLASETAIWGYKHVRHRPYYWADKKLLLKRIFRSSNLAVWQKRRESGFELGLATTLNVAIIGPNKIWVGGVGDSSVLLYREGLIDVLTSPDIDEKGRLTNALGLKRLGLVAHITVEEFVPGDIVVMATAGVTNYVSEDEIRVVCEMAGDTTESLTNAVVQLLRTAEEKGSRDNMTACIMKRLVSAGE